MSERVYRRYLRSGRSILIDVVTVSSVGIVLVGLVTLFSPVERFMDSPQGVYGPFRSWNTEVLKYHLMPGITEMSRIESWGSLFWFPPPGGYSAAQLGGAYPSLRAINGSGYLSYPPGSFIATSILTHGNLQAIKILGAVLMAATLALLAFAAAGKDYWRQSLVLFGPVAISSPLVVHHLTTSFWAYNWYLFFVSLGLAGIRAGNEDLRRLFVGLSFFGSAFTHWMGIVFGLALLIAVTVAPGNNVKRDIEVWAIKCAVIAATVMTLWTLVSYESVSAVIGSLFDRIDARLILGNHEEYGLSDLSLSLSHSYALTWFFLIGLGLHWRLHSQAQNPPITGDKNELLILSLAVIAGLETFIFFQHALVHPFAQLCLLPILFFSASRTLKYSASNPRFAIPKKSIVVASSLLVLGNVASYLHVYDSASAIVS